MTNRGELLTVGAVSARTTTRMVLAGVIALALLTGLSSGQDVKPGWSIPDGLSWQPVNGYPLTYRDLGQGVPIVLIHGSVTDYRTWEPQFDAFSKSHRLIAVSLRHYYPEAWKGEGATFSIEQHAADVAELIKRLNLGKVHLVGWSRGGNVAIEIAKAHPGLIRTLIMEDGGIVMAAEDAPEARKAAETLRSEISRNNIRTLQENLRTGGPEKAAEGFVEAAVGPGAWQKTPPATQQMVLQNIYTELGDISRPSTTCADLQRFDFPVLLLNGEKSPKRYALLYAEMRKCKSFPEPIVIPNAIHNIHRSAAEVYNRTVLEFVSRH